MRTILTAVAALLMNTFYCPRVFVGSTGTPEMMNHDAQDVQCGAIAAKIIHGNVQEAALQTTRPVVADANNTSNVKDAQPIVATVAEQGEATQPLILPHDALALKIWRDPISNGATAFIMRTDPTSGTRTMMALSIVSAATNANGEEGANAYPILAS